MHVASYEPTRRRARTGHNGGRPDGGQHASLVLHWSPRTAWAGWCEEQRHAHQGLMYRRGAMSVHKTRAKGAVMDVARGELVEKELDAMIERRSRQKDPEEESE